MKYYKISENELKKLINVLDNNPTDKYHDAEFHDESNVLTITGHYGVGFNFKHVQFEELKEGLDINKLEGAIWHGCPKTHAHTEFTELKFKGDGMFISGFCLHCEEEMVRLSEKKK